MLTVPAVILAGAAAAALARRATARGGDRDGSVDGASNDATNVGPVKPQLSSSSANGADALVKPQRSVAVKLFKQLCLRCPPQTGKAKELLRESMGHEIVVIARFFEDAAIFVLSRLWFDTISSYCLGLRPITYCSSPEAAGLLEAECVSLAPAWRQYVFALVALPIAGLLKHLVEWSGLTKKRGFDQVPMMLKYIVGWAFAFATEAYLAELKVAHADHLCWSSSDGGTPSCHVFDVAVASSFTLIGGLVLLLLKPWAAEVECGSGVAVDFAEDLLEDFSAMLVRALSVVVMVLWYDAAHELVMWNNEATESGKTTVTVKLTVLWAVAITYVGSIVSAALEQWEGDLKKKGGRLLFVDCVCSYSDLLQDSLAFVAGCAWSDVVCAIFTSLNSVTPTPSVLLANTAISVLVAAIALVWFVVTGNNTSSPSASAASRSHVEKYYITNALAFFVGWVWFVADRNMGAQLALAMEGVITVTNNAFDLQLRLAWGDYAGAVVWVSLCTGLVFWLQHRAVQALAKGVGAEHPKPELLRRMKSAKVGSGKKAELV